MKIAFVGDVMLGRLVNDELAVTGPVYPWGDTLPLLGLADIRIGNLEFVLSDDGVPWPDKVFHFRSDRANIASLTAASLTMVSLANNHVLDYGADALLEMLTALDEHGVVHAGAGTDRDEARRMARYRHGDTTLGFLALTDNEPGWEAGPSRPGVHYVPIDVADGRAVELLASVAHARTEVDLLVVSAHWGGNWGFDAPAGHREFAHALIDAGADVVYGHSPHVVRGIEVYRERPILYSTGDFIDDYAVDQDERNDQSFVFMLETERGIPTELRLHPTIISGFQARMARSAAPRIAGRLQELCAGLGTASTWLDDENCLVVPLRADEASESLPEGP